MAKTKPSEERKLGTSDAKRVLTRPRRRTDAGDFDYKRDAASRGNVSDDNLCFTSDCPPITLIKPDWKGALPTTWRPFPAIDPEDQYTFLHARKSAKEDDFTDWHRGLPGINFVGTDRQITCLLWDPRWKHTRGYNFKENPYNVLYYAIKGAVDDGEAMIGRKDVFHGKWNRYFKKNMNCNPSNKIGFFQGALYQHGDKVYVAGGKPPLGLGEDDNPVIIMQGKSSDYMKSGVFGLQKVLNQHPEGWNGDTDDLDAAFLHADPTSLDHGRFLTAYNPKKHKAKLAFMNGTAKSSSKSEDVEYEEPDEDDADTDSDDEKGKLTGWEMTVLDKLYYHNKAGDRKRAKLDLTDYADKIRQQYLWWDDILHFPETEELCLWLAQAFRSVPRMLQFAWQDNPEFFTAEVKGVLKARTSGPGAEMPSDDDEEEEKSSRSRRRSAVLEDDEEESDVDDDDGFEDDDDPDADEGDEGEEDSEDGDDIDEADEADEDEESDEDEGAEEDEAEESEDDEEDAQVSKAVDAAKRRAAKRHTAADDDEAAQEESMASKKAAKPKASAKKKVAVAKKPAAKKKSK